MGLLQQPIERKLSAMLGTEVTFEKLNVSLIGGSIEAQGVSVAGKGPRAPVLSIRRVRAEISLGAALKKEFVVKSLTIERPVVTIVRGSDGQTNLPKRLADTSATSESTADSRDDSDATAGSEGTWKFEARKVLIVDGEVHYRDAAGYHVAAEQILAEIKEGQSGLEITLIADSTGRLDIPSDLGQVRLHGHAQNVADLSNWREASLRGNVEVGEMLRARVDVPSLKPLDVKVEINGTADLNALAGLLPPDIKAIDAVRAGGLRGRVELNGRATYRSPEGLRIPELTLRAVDVIFSA